MQFCKNNANLMNFVNPGGPHFSPLRQSCRPPIMDKLTFVMNPKPSYFVRNPILTLNRMQGFRSQNGVFQVTLLTHLARI